jgi:hypothetical protein
MERTIDSDNIGLTEHLLERFYPASSNLFFGLSRKRLVIKVEEFLAIEWNKTSQYTFTDTADTDSGYHFTFDIEGVLSDGGDVPFTPCDLLMGGNKVADKCKHGKDDYLLITIIQKTLTMFSDRDDIRSSNFSNKDFLLVGSSQVNVIGS